MRLFHISEDSDIKEFKPRLPLRRDLDQNIGLVWAIDDKRLPNFLTPRDCPRVAYYCDSSSTEIDKKRFFSSSTVNHALVIEKQWYQIMTKTSLYLYEFDAKDFVLQDDIAGYYVSTKTQYPIKRIVVTDLFAELLKRNVEIRIVDNLWEIADAVKLSTLKWSLCRMRNAAPPLSV